MANFILSRMLCFLDYTSFNAPNLCLLSTTCRTSMPVPPMLLPCQSYFFLHISFFSTLFYYLSLVVFLLSLIFPVVYVLVLVFVFVFFSPIGFFSTWFLFVHLIVFVLVHLVLHDIPSSRYYDTCFCFFFKTLLVSCLLGFVLSTSLFC